MIRQAKALFVVAALFGVLAFAAQASASQQRQHLGAFGSSTEPAALAVDASSGEVYVVDPLEQVIRRFDSEGNPAPFAALGGSNVLNGSDAGSDNDQTPANGFSLDPSSQVAVDSSGTATDGNIYLADSANNVVDVFAASGEYIGQLTGAGTNSSEPTQTWAEVFAYPCGVAVDASGALYVATAFNGQIDRYAAAASPPVDGDLQAQITELPFGTCGLAADSAGAVYATTSAFGSPGILTRYEATDFGSAAPAGTTVDPTATAVALDPADDSIFVDQGAQIAHYDSSGASLESPFGSPPLQSSRGVAVNEGATRVYASEHHEVPPPGEGEEPSFVSEVNVFGPLVTVPDSTTGVADAITSTAATLHGQVDPDGIELTECSFEYGTGTSYGQSAPCTETPAEIGSGSGAVDVGAEVTELKPNTTYHFRLRAANPNGQGPAGEDQSFTTAGVSPLISKTSASQIGITAATLEAEIDPVGSPTSYRFEYLSEAAYLANGNSFAGPNEPQRSPDPDASIGEGTEPVAVSANLIELQPGTTYRFRVVATNGVGTREGEAKSFKTFALPSAQPDTCPNAAIRAEQGAQNLGDCRAFEMVSPVDKNGGEVMVEFRRTHAAADGDALAYASLSGFADSPGGSLVFEYMGLRTASGWRSHGITPPQEPGDSESLPFQVYAEYRGEFSEDLSQAVLLATSPLTGAPNVAETHNLYLRDDLRRPGLGSYRLLSDSFAPVPDYGLSPNRASYRAPPADASEDFSHVIFESELNLTPEASGTQRKLYEWADGEVRLAGILPDGQPATCAGGEACSIAGRGAGSENTGLYTDSTISDDGRRVFFTSPSEGAGNVSVESHLYMRIDGTSTVQIDESEKASPTPVDIVYPEQAANFWRASDDGTKVFFTSKEQLTEDDDNNAVDLFEYDASKPEDELNLTRISGAGGGVNSNGFYFGVIGIDEAGEYVYFVADRQLVSGGPPLGVVGGGDNAGIFLYHAGELRFIGQVPRDEELALIGRSGFTTWPRAARVTPDGQRMVFQASSGAGLTGQDQGGAIYLYDAEANSGSGELTCVLCDVTGAPLSGGAQLFLGQGISVGNSRSNPHDNRPFSEDGKRVFFHTRERLLPEDRNGSVMDVYEYEVETGELHLITPGTATEDSYFLEASANGDDVFIATRERLVGRDTGNDYDIYDVRVGGGFPEPPPAVLCEGDACLVPPIPPQDPTPASSSFRGAGNAKPKARARCRRGSRRVTRKGKARCLKPRKAKNRKTKKRANANRRTSK